MDNNIQTTLNMTSDQSFNDLKNLGRYNLSINQTGPLLYVSDFDILFQPENVLIGLYVPVILVSLVTNILLIVVAVKCNYTKNVTNIFLVNLSVADLLVTGVCMPIQLSKAITLVWFYGETVCKIVNYIQGVAVAASVFTITAMSVDRWLSITSEPRLRPPGRRQSLLLLSLLWMIALLIFIPLFIVASVRKESVPVISQANKNISVETKDIHFCTEEWPSPDIRTHFGTFSFTLVYAIPGTITILSYACMGRTLCSVRPPFDIDEGTVSMQQGLRLMKERKRVAWILLMLAVFFALCWMPYNMMQLLLDINAVNPKDLSMYLPYALFLGHANSAINPIVYCLMTKNFQRSVHKLLCGRPACQQTKFTWRCNKKPDGSSSDYELYHDPNKRCYLQLKMAIGLFKNVMSMFKQFCEHCTLHGAYYFYQNSSSWLHCIWIIIIGVSMCLCAYLSHMIWWKFISNPTFTVVESTHYPIDSISFPAISVCDTEIVYGPNTNNITWILNLQRYDQEKIETFYRSFTNVKNNSYEPEAYVEKMHKALGQLGFTYDILLNQLSRPCDVLIRECGWRSKPFKCVNMFRRVLTVVGYCCQFDMNYFRDHVMENTNFEAGIEVSEGLYLTVNTKTILANGNSIDSASYLYVFDSQNNLTLYDSSVVITGAAYYDVTVAVWAIDSSEDVKSLSLTSRKCFLSVDSKKAVESYEGCLTQNIMEKVILQCRCLPFHYDPSHLDVNDYTPCTWERLKCIYNMLDQVQNEISNRVSERECFQKCDHVQYEAETIYLKIDRNLDNFSPGESRLAVHFGDNTCIKYRREVLYAWDQILANLGGIFGLCLGGSIVSIIELLWFLLELLLTVFSLEKKKVVPKNGRGVDRTVQVKPAKKF